MTGISLIRSKMMTAETASFRCLFAAMASAFVAYEAHSESLIELPSGSITEAIKAAIETVDDGGTVRLAAGTYTISETLTLSRGITLEGAGRTATTLDFGNACRGFSLSHDDAKVCNLKIYQGKVSNNGGGVNMSKGVVSNCVISACMTTGNSHHGGGIYMTGGQVVDCEITGCKYDSLYSQGNAIWMNNGTVARCDIHGNNGGYGHTSYLYGSHAVFINGGTLKDSMIRDNSTNLAGIKQANGTVANCLIYGNTSPNNAAGIWKSNGTTVFCTIYGNVKTGDTTGCSGICHTGGTTKNCIIWGNGPEGGTVGSCSVSGNAANFVNNVIDKALADYPDNVVGNPDFAAASRGDFRISHSISPAIGYATPVANITTDFSGNPRNATAPTAGAFEYDHAIVAVPVLPFLYANGQRQVADISDCADYEVLENEGGTVAGFYSVKLRLVVAGSTWADGTTADKIVQYEIKGQVVLHSTDGYAEIAAAIASVDDGETILFDEGTYTVSSTIALSRPVTLKGVNRDNVILDFANGCRGFTLSNKDASLRDLTIYRGKINVQKEHGGGVLMSAGVVSNCLIKTCVAQSNYSCGGGVYMTGGTVIDCEFTGCSFSGVYGHGNAIYMTAGLVTGCDIHGNNGGYSHSNPAYGDGIVYIAGGTIENSKIHGNTKKSNPGISMNTGGMVRNCLIYGNKATDDNTYGSGGIYMTAGTAVFNTVYGNSMKGDTTGRSGIYRSGGTAKNNIFWANGPAGSTAGSCEVSGSANTFVNNIVDKALDNYPDNRAADPKFTDAENGDFTISSRSSSAYGYAVPVEKITTDITGFTRDAEAPTSGAYEYDPSSETFEVDISFTQSDYRLGSSVTVQAVVMGAEIADVDLKWYLDGAELTGETGEYLTLNGLAVGHHSLTIGAVKKSGGEPVSKECVDCLAIRPVECFVNTTGSGTYPFDTVEKGTNSLQAVMAALWTEADVTSVVHVAAGKYTLASGVRLQDKIRVLGEGRDLVTFVCSEGRAFDVANSASEVSGITVSNSPAAFSVSSGLIRDCLAKNITYTSGHGAGFSVTGGKVYNVEAINCNASGLYYGGGGLYITGGTVSNIFIKGGLSYDSFDHGHGGGIYATGGTVKNATVVGTKMSNVNGCAIKATGGTFEYCNVYGCTSTASRVVSLNGATARNCLFAGNVGRGTRETVYLSGTFDCCTFGANANDGTCLSATNVIARNTIFAECGGTNLLFGTYSHCCAPSLENGVNGNLAANPQFRNEERYDFRLSGSSPCVNKGDWTCLGATRAEVRAMKDLAGKPRLYGGQLDMGCYENQNLGTILFAR